MTRDDNREWTISSRWPGGDNLLPVVMHVSGPECEKIRVVPRSRLEQVEAELARAQEALRELQAGRLSSSLGGGDPGMIFDADDAAVERRRRGTVTFDIDAVDKAFRVLESAGSSDTEVQS